MSVSLTLTMRVSSSVFDLLLETRGAIGTPLGQMAGEIDVDGSRDHLYNFPT